MLTNFCSSQGRLAEAFWAGFVVLSFKSKWSYAKQIPTLGD